MYSNEEIKHYVRHLHRGPAQNTFIVSPGVKYHCQKDEIVIEYNDTR